MVNCDFLVTSSPSSPATLAFTVYVVPGSSRSSAFHLPPSPAIAPVSAPTSPEPLTVTVLSRPLCAKTRSWVETGTSVFRLMLVETEAASGSSASADSESEPLLGSPEAPVVSSAEPPLRMSSPLSQALSIEVPSSRADSATRPRTRRLREDMLDSLDSHESARTVRLGLLQSIRWRSEPTKPRMPL